MDKLQISVKEALPYLEIEQTPYGVMCTTTWGGHLSWFESGGSRWFTKPVCCKAPSLTSTVFHSASA